MVWEEHAEWVDEEMKTKIPVFIEDETKKIVENIDSENYNFLLEGDNLHSLHLLEKTHAGRITQVKKILFLTTKLLIKKTYIRILNG